MELTAPAVVFLNGALSPECERLADAILAARPGVLVVVALD